MPAAKVDRGTIGMGHGSTHKHGGVTLHYPPIPFGGSDTLAKGLYVFEFGKPVWIPMADVNRRATHPIQEFASLPFATTPTKRFVAKNQLL
ncbi:MAG: hypothetical protein KDA84_28915, partial [Planctomycetaceae bacterium]|nr:hypothetical protein [Planctomycetaceae bacterium]